MVTPAGRVAYENKKFKDARSGAVYYQDFK
jgi:hypothetical protein